MVLSRNYWTKNIQEMIGKPHEFMILRTDHYAFGRDIDRMERGVEVINLCNSLTVINDACKKTNINKDFEFSVLYDVLSVIYSGKEFTDKDLERLYEFKTNLEEFALGMQFFSPDITQHLYLPSDTTLAILGFSFEDQKEFYRLDKFEYEEALDWFYRIEEEYFRGLLSLTDLKSQTLKKFNEGLKGLQVKKEKKAA